MVKLPAAIIYQTWGEERGTAGGVGEQKLGFIDVGRLWETGCFNSCVSSPSAGARIQSGSNILRNTGAAGVPTAAPESARLRAATLSALHLGSERSRPAPF